MDNPGYEYKIIISTSGRFAAGTDARVFIKLIGTHGESEEMELKDDTTGKKLFEAGSIDEFDVKIEQEIGFISKINLRHDDSGHFSGWHPNKIEITDIKRNRKFRFDCNRWLAKDEGDKRISVELENKVLPVVKIDQLEGKNRPLHNTVKFITKQFVVRRGQSIFMDIQLARPFYRQTDKFHITLTTGKKPREFDKSFVHIQRVDELDAFGQTWAYKIIGVDNDILHIEVNCPCNALVAKYEMNIEDDDEVIYKHQYPLVVLFNPWNKIDDVYIKDDECRKEYVLRQHGLIFTGSSKHQHPVNWYFGQFEEISLDCVFKLLDTTSPLGRESPIEVTRRLSSLVNSCDNNGLLVGNWSGNYEGGQTPTYWTSSPPIFESYMETNKSVKYGQCWVFSALLTSILRCLGIPCRSVTNFNSAHDTNNNISKDVFLDEECDVIKDLSSDSIWNFHCWNDAWMARPDLKPGYGGWQAVDSTPQETSYGLYQCGPCSLRTIKEGDIDYPYDGKFIMAEVNSDIFYHKKGTNGQWEVVEIHRSHVGKKISTKAVGKSTREDITREYKFAENSALERASVRKAMGKAGNVAVISTPKTLEMKVKPVANAVEIGKDIEVKVHLKNTANKDLSLSISVGGSIVRYNGVCKGEPISMKRKEEISGDSEKAVTFTIKGEKYMKYLNEFTTVRLFIACTVMETKQVCTSAKLVEIRRPDLKFQNVPSMIKFGEELKLEVIMENPLDVELTGCKLHLDGTLMKERISLECSNIKGNTSSKMEVTLSPNTRIGSKSLLATFNSDQLAGINSSTKFKVI